MKRRNYVSLKPPVPVQPRWRGDEPCLQAPEAFHPAQGDFFAARTAKWICSRCPSKAPCLDWALDDPNLEGIHAGTTARQRAKIRGSRLKK